MEAPTLSYTVGELIRLLESLPPDLPILVSGYESGFENFYQPYVVRLNHLPDNPYYEGEFQLANKDDKEWIEGVVLTRVNR
ncbi:MAG: hypothetical protein D4R93_06625 [Deltaproteobacteria bacterium]|nr:MAG: hypothetical protein D4R93_06625 [Deltaproteobacteria bacterium]